MLNDVFGTGYIRFMVAFFIPVILWLLIGNKIIDFFKKWQYGCNTVREYLLQTPEKSGTPTIGGIPLYIFLMFSFSVCSAKIGTDILVSVFAISIFFILGLFDDYMKVFVNNTKGLSAKYKFFIECISAFLLVYGLMYSECYLDLYSIRIHFFNENLNLGHWYILFAVFIIVGAANAFNLTDGMDGLVSGVTIPILLALFALGLFTVDFASKGDLLIDILTYISALIGTLTGFLFFNKHPAKIFMGDSGSLMIGASVSVLGILLKIELVLAVLCFVPILETLSVIIQVIFFKKYKKRVFLMAPIHHHFEKKGIPERKLVVYFSAISLITSLLGFFMVYIR